MVLLAALAGCDYCKIPRVSLLTALQIMRCMPPGSAKAADVPEAARAAGFPRLLDDTVVPILEHGMKGYIHAVAARVSIECTPFDMPPAVAMEVALQQPRRGRLVRLPCVVLPTQPAAQARPELPRPVFKSSNTIKLTVGMVRGAVLPPVDTWQARKPALAELQAFARTRGMTGFGVQSKERLAKRCKEHLACEEERGGIIGLRAPSDGLALLQEQGGWDIAHCA